MSLVGGFPGILDMRRRTIRGPVNPLDKSTVVSIFPKEIDEVKHTIQPGRFIISPGSYESPAILVVGPSSWWRDIDREQPLLEIPVSSIQIADSIVKDYCNGYLACNMGDCMPGLFYLPGEIKVEQLKKEFSNKVDAAQVKQKNWYSLLVKMADALWARSSGNPLAISDDMRLAARELNLITNKDWMKDFTMVNMVRCKACGALKNPEYPICATCRFPDPSHPMTKQLMELADKLPKAQ
jgi:hypothetical protein